MAQLMVGLRLHAHGWCGGRAETGHWGRVAAVLALHGRADDGRQGTAAGARGGGGGGGVGWAVLE